MFRPQIFNIVIFEPKNVNVAFIIHIYLFNPWLSKM